MLKRWIVPLGQQYSLNDQIFICYLNNLTVRELWALALVVWVEEQQLKSFSGDFFTRESLVAEAASGFYYRADRVELCLTTAIEFLEEIFRVYKIPIEITYDYRIAGWSGEAMIIEINRV